MTLKKIKLCKIYQKTKPNSLKISKFQICKCLKLIIHNDSKPEVWSCPTYKIKSLNGSKWKWLVSQVLKRSTLKTSALLDKFAIKLYNKLMVNKVLQVLLKKITVLALRLKKYWKIMKGKNGLAMFHKVNKRLSHLNIQLKKWNELQQDWTDLSNLTIHFWILNSSSLIKS